MKKTKKKVIIGVVIIAVLLIIGIVSYVMYNKQQLEMLFEETNKLSQMSLDEEEIDMKIKTKGKYAIVEETMKNYVNDVKNLSNDIINLCKESDLDKILEIENIKTDGPEFISTKEKISEFRAQINEKMEKLQESLKEENIVAAIENKNLSNSYKELYKTVMFDEGTLNELSSSEDEIKSVLDEVNTTLDALDKVIDFLKENSNYWEVKDDKIQFNNVKKLTEYYQILNSVGE